MKNLTIEDITLDTASASGFLNWLSQEIPGPLLTTNGDLLAAEGHAALPHDDIVNCPSLREWTINPTAQSISLTIYKRSSSETINPTKDILLSLGIELDKSGETNPVFGFFISPDLTKDMESSAQTFSRLLPGAVDLIDAAAREETDVFA